MFRLDIPASLVRQAAIDAAYEVEAAHELVKSATLKTGLNSKQTVTAHRMAAEAEARARRLGRKVN